MRNEMLAIWRYEKRIEVTKRKQTRNDIHICTYQPYKQAMPNDVLLSVKLVRDENHLRINC